mmetsp:Transcript_32265/g.74279  ORF Transcript_32265/g.74279 Transcript_32265/m.74279 type:complete len:101 (-) Transcript_32265:92-394(-)
MRAKCPPAPGLELPPEVLRRDRSLAHYEPLEWANRTLLPQSSKHNVTFYTYDGMPVALKEYALGTATEKRMFEREVDALVKLRPHSHVMRVELLFTGENA